ncbi:MAG TPA: serine hydrolase, partial [Usitatibacter sp.]|nr:serine hydrolase [Usitatibacter sp.]
MKRRLWVLQVLMLVAIFAVWQLLTQPGLITPFFWDNPDRAAFFFGEPVKIFKVIYAWFTDETGAIYQHLWVTLEETALAFGIGAALGLAVGLWLGLSPLASALFDPYITAANAMPRVVLAPIFMVWFGLGIWSKVALGVTLVFFIVFFNVYQGVKEVSPVVLNNSIMLGANRRQLLRHVYLPSATSWVFSSLHVSVGMAFVGAVVAIARRGKLAYFRAFGYLDKDRGVPMPLDAIFSPASMEKPMVAVAALQLVEQGRMVMGDPVAKYIPQFAGMKVARMSADGMHIAGTEAQKRPMTIQDLMRHTAGLTYGRRGEDELSRQYPASSNWSAENLTGPQFIDRLASLPLHYQPGTRWDYSFGYDVLGLVIEKVTGKRLGESMRETIFDPLGMSDAAFVIAPEKRDRYARPLDRNPDTGRPQRIRDVRERGRFDCGGGCASYTAADYLRFSQMLLDGGALDGHRILSRKFVEYMTSDQLGGGVDR